MKINKIVKPGQPGTKKLMERYGENLVCVRYRYDNESKRKFKTIELIIDNKPWQPNKERIPMNKLINLRIDAKEGELQGLVKKTGGKWNARQKIWRLPYKYVLELGLTARIVK